MVSTSLMKSFMFSNIFSYLLPAVIYSFVRRFHHQRVGSEGAACWWCMLELNFRTVCARPCTANSFYFLSCFVCLRCSTSRAPQTPTLFEIGLKSQLGTFLSLLLFFFVVVVPILCCFWWSLKNCSKRKKKKNCISVFMLRGTAKYKSLRGGKGKQRRQGAGDTVQ